MGNNTKGKRSRKKKSGRVHSNTTIAVKFDCSQAVDHIHSMINNLQDAVPQGYLDRMVHDWITEQAQKQLAILHRIELEQMKQEIKAAIRYKPGSELKAEYAQYVEY